MQRRKTQIKHTRSVIWLVCLNVNILIVDSKREWTNVDTKGSARVTLKFLMPNRIVPSTYWHPSGSVVVVVMITQQDELLEVCL